MTGISARLVSTASMFLFSLGVQAQGAATPAANHDPETAVISTADIDLFWHAYDTWKTTANSAPDRLAAILDRDYIKKGSRGVQDFIPDRIISADALSKMILKDPKYYETVRANTGKMQSFVPEIRRGFQRLEQIYPDAVFPPVYFVIGRRNSGGTDTENGLIIGAEMFADTGSRIHLSEVVCIVVHELIHYQQKAKGEDLITAVMTEGAADFIAELITGNQIDENIKPYGDSHEQELWKKFQEDAAKNDFAPWLYNGDDQKRVGPPDSSSKSAASTSSAAKTVACCSPSSLQPSTKPSKNSSATPPPLPSSSSKPKPKSSSRRTGETKR